MYQTHSTIGRGGLKSLTLLVTLFLVSSPSVSQTASAPTTPDLMIDQIKECVVFVQGAYSAQEMHIVNGVSTSVTVEKPLSGTGFLIFVADPRLGKDNLGKDNGLTYLVTNRHMIREPNAAGVLGEGPYFKDLTVRINLKSASPDGTQFANTTISVVDQAGSLLWFVDSQDETVDLAITPFFPDEKIADYKTIPSTLFATKDLVKAQQINENDELLFAGLFAWSPGTKKNYPIVRHGKVARLSGERIPLDKTRPDRTVDAHLADVMSFGGNSGSPVFVRLGGIREPLIGPPTTGFSYYLLGVMEGFFPENMDFAINVAQLRGSAAQNRGIAAVVPIDKVLLLLDSARGKAYLDRIVAGTLAKNGDLQGATKLYEEAVGLLEKTSPLHSDYAVLLEDYAAVLRKQGRSGQAKAAEEHATRIRGDAQNDRLHPKI